MKPYSTMLLTAVLTLCLCVSLSAVPADGNDNSLKTTLFLRGGSQSVSDSTLGAGITIAAGADFKLTGNLSVETEAFMSSNDSLNDDDGLEALGTGKLTRYGLNLAVCRHIPITKKFRGYLKAGGTYVIFDFKAHDLFQQLGYRAQEDLDNRFGFHAGGGLDYLFTRSLSLNVEVRYTVLSTDGTWSVTDQRTNIANSGTTSVDLNHLSLLAGVRFSL